MARRRNTWELVYNIAGRFGRVECSSQASESLTRRLNGGPSRQASVQDVLIPEPVHELMRSTDVSTWTATVLCNGEPVASGGWSFVDVRRAEGAYCTVSLQVLEDDARAAVPWPSVSSWRPSRQDDEVVGYLASDYNHQFPTGDIHDQRVLREPPEPLARWDTADVFFYDVKPVLRSELFDGIATLSDGQQWPWVFGQPGFTTSDENGITDVPGSPGWVYDEQTGPPVTYKVLIAVGAVEATTVTLYVYVDDAELVLYDIPVYVGQNAAGNTVSYLDSTDFSFPDSPDGTITSADTANAPHYIGWDDGEATSGGAGDVIWEVLSASGVRFDAGEVSRLRGYLNTYRLSGYVDEQVDPLEWLRAEVLPVVGATLEPGPVGLRPVLLPWAHEDLRASALPPLVVGLDLFAEELRLETVTTDPPRGVLVSYALRANTGKFARSVSWPPVSKSEVDEVRLGSVSDGATAGRVAREQAVSRSLRPVRAKFVIHDLDRYGVGGTQRLRPGQRYRVTWPDMGWTDVPCTVDTVEHGEDGDGVVLLADPDEG